MSKPDRNYLETFFEVSAALTLAMKEQNSPRVGEAYEVQGHPALYDLAIELTDKFQEKHKDTEWGIDLDFIDTIDAFCHEELYGGLKYAVINPELLYPISVGEGFISSIINGHRKYPYRLEGNKFEVFVFGRWRSADKGEFNF